MPAASVFLLCGLLAAPAALAQAAKPTFHDWAATPPMGWNSWDCFGPAVNEEQTLANADYIAKNLKSHGWDLITIDGQWARSQPELTRTSGGMDLEMDASGRLLPAANRFPSSRETRSFKPLADAIHARGLKFGLHLLRGIPRLAVKQNTPIAGTDLHAADIADTTSTCHWSDDTYGIDMSRLGAQAYYDSVFALLASWEIDFIKIDDLAAPYHKGDIEAIRKAIDKTGRPIVLSTSPGPLPIEQADHIAANANTWRISHDFWDTWPALHAQFANLGDWAAHRGPFGFPDADMLPVGSLRLWKDGVHWTKFTRDEQITLMTLWSIARSPLIVGGNLPDNDEFTLSLLTNDEVIAVNQHSEKNRHVFKRGDQIAWMAQVPRSTDVNLALFNASSPPRRKNAAAGARAEPPATRAAAVLVSLKDLGLAGPCRVRDLWSHRDLGTEKDTISVTINPHGAVLYRLHPEP
jgi:alpha-galactosidase